MAPNFDLNLTPFAVELFVGGIVTDDVTLIDVGENARVDLVCL